jgi:hypothetical protein
MLPKKIIKYIAKIVCGMLGLGLIYIVVPVIHSILKHEKIFTTTPLGPYQVPLNPFVFVATIFSLFMLGKIYIWIDNYSKVIQKSLPCLLVLCFFGAEALTVCLIRIPSFWPLLVAILLIVIMTMNASCRGAVIKNKECNKKDYLILWAPITICLITSIVIFCFLYYYIKLHDRISYLTALPPLLVLIPRWLMRSNKMRIDGLGQAPEEIGYYVWFTVFTVLTFIATAAQVSFIWMFNIIELNRGEVFSKNWFDEYGNFCCDNCSYDIMVLYVFLGVMGFVGYYVFPKLARQQGGGIIIV